MYQRTRIKFCGITTAHDAEAAIAAGADALGLVFFPPSPRYISVPKAAEISSMVPAFVSVTGLFVNCDRGVVEDCLAHCRLDLLQFHGDEDAGYCRSFGKPYMKAFRVKPGDDILARCSAYSDAAALLLDAWHPELHGGTGLSFDWALLDALPTGLRRRLVLAGGLTPANAAAAVQKVRPWALDVSSGIESTPGHKNVKDMQAFAAAVRAADATAGEAG